MRRRGRFRCVASADTLQCDGWPSLQLLIWYSVVKCMMSLTSMDEVRCPLTATPSGRNMCVAPSLTTRQCSIREGPSSNIICTNYTYKLHSSEHLILLPLLPHNPPLALLPHNPPLHPLPSMRNILIRTHRRLRSPLRLKRLRRQQLPQPPGLPRLMLPRAHQRHRLP